MAIRLCGFAALRCFLVILNSFYIGVAFFLVGVVIAARTLAYNFSVSIPIGIAVVAAFLFCVAVMGLVGLFRHNQVIMFFYMVFLGLSGLALFAVSVAALAIPRSYQENVFQDAWKSLSYNYKGYLQDSLDCCGFSDDTQYLVQENGRVVTEECEKGHPLCNSTTLFENCCANWNASSVLVNVSDGCLHEPIPLCPQCQSCYMKWEGSVLTGLKTAGALGLIFSLTQVIGIVLTVQFRDLKDPSINPRNFL